MKMLRLTARYFPFPQPTSAPTEPSGSSCRKRSTIGQGFGVFVSHTRVDVPFLGATHTLYRVEEKWEAICS